MRASERADVIVVGLGAMGSATCFQLARRGVSVIGLDRYRPPHPYGSTHGDTRITRLAIGEGREFVPLVARSHELWREIEAESGADLLTVTGGLTIAHPTSEFLTRTRALAREFGIAHEDLTNAQLRDRFPMFSVDDQHQGYYEHGSGYVRPEAAVSAQLELAEHHGAQLRLGERVIEWSSTNDAVSATTDGGRFEADRLVICAGPWIAELFPEGARTFAVYRQHLFWFVIREGYEQLRELPIFVWDFGGERERVVHLRGFYGFPAIDGPDGGLKLATEHYEEPTTPDGRQHPATPEQTEAMYREIVAGQLPWLQDRAVRTVSCLYTCTAGSRFVVDRHPAHDNVTIVSACSGHGFKHSPAIGEAVAQRIAAGTSDLDLSPFRLTPCHDGMPRAAPSA